MKFNAQLDKLGTETAFAVSADAEAWSKKGYKVYPFHLSDMNIPTQKGFKDIEQFRIAVLEQTGVSFCTRNHFGRPGVDEKEHFIRFSYSGIGVHDIREGIDKFKSWIAA